MRILDNISELFGDDLKSELGGREDVAIAAGTFSIHAFAALRDELRRLDKFRFVFTGPSFVTDGGTGRSSAREFIIPPVMNRRDLAGTPFEIRLRNKMTTRALARDCADWIREKAEFRSNPGSAIPAFLCARGSDGGAAYTGLNGFSAADLGYQPGTLTMINKITEEQAVARYAALFDQLWSEPGRLKNVTEELCRQLEQVYAENSPARIYHLMLSIIFRTFLEDINEDLLPNDRTGFRDTKVWSTLYKFQQDAALGLIHKLETYNGCILADSVGLGKTFTALAVIKYYELRNKSVLVLCPKKLADNWLTYNKNLTTNILAEDRLNYDVLAHTDLLRASGYSMGMPLDQVNWGNYDLVVIDESHNFRNDEATQAQGEADTRYRALLNKVIRSSVRTSSANATCFSKASKCCRYSSSTRSPNTGATARTASSWPATTRPCSRRNMSGRSASSKSSIRPTLLGTPTSSAIQPAASTTDISRSTRRAGWLTPTSTGPAKSQERQRTPRLTI